MLKFIFSAGSIGIFIAACSPTIADDRSEPVSENVETSPAISEASTPNYNRPNVLIILVDDLGWADLGFRGSDIETPSIDRLAREGLVLNRFYAMPICTPTRSALMTARDPMKLGTAYAGFQPWQNGGVSPEEHFCRRAFKPQVIKPL